MPIKTELTAQVPIEGEKEGGVEWVADQAAITVQELREVDRKDQIKVFGFFKIIRFLVKGGAKAGSWGEERKSTARLTFYCNLISDLRFYLICTFYCKHIFHINLSQLEGLQNSVPFQRC